MTSYFPTRNRQAPPDPWELEAVADHYLAGRRVSAEMFIRVKSLKDMGKRVLLSTPVPANGADESIPSRFKAQYCENCEGAGYLFVEAIMSGPYKDNPGHLREGDMTIECPASHNGAWYRVIKERYACPVCHGMPLSGGAS